MEDLNNINAHNECSVGFWDVDVTLEEAMNHQIDITSSQYEGIDILSYSVFLLLQTASLH